MVTFVPHSFTAGLNPFGKACSSWTASRIRSSLLSDFCFSSFSLIFRSTLRQSRPNKARLKCPYVGASVCPQKVSLISVQFGMSDARQYAV